MRKLRLWRVDCTSNLGYNAPSKFIVSEGDRLWKAEQMAIEEAQASSRLKDFPKTWTFTATLMDREFLNGKWYTLHDYSLKTSKES
jgi:hypothetical protein